MLEKNVSDLLEYYKKNKVPHCHYFGVVEANTSIYSKENSHLVKNVKVVCRNVALNIDTIKVQVLIACKIDPSNEQIAKAIDLFNN